MVDRPRVWDMNKSTNAPQLYDRVQLPVYPNPWAYEGKFGKVVRVPRRRRYNTGSGMVDCKTQGVVFLDEGKRVMVMLEDCRVVSEGDSHAPEK